MSLSVRTTMMAGASNMDSDFFDAVVTLIRSSSSRLISARSISDGPGFCARAGNGAPSRSDQARPVLSAACRIPVVLALLPTIHFQYRQVLCKAVDRWISTTDSVRSAISRICVTLDGPPHDWDRRRHESAAEFA